MFLFLDKRCCICFLNFYLTSHEMIKYFDFVRADSDNITIICYIKCNITFWFLYDRKTFFVDFFLMRFVYTYYIVTV